MQAILAGGRAEQIHAELLFALSHTVGNAALAEALLRRDGGPELIPYQSPEREIGTEVFDWGGGASEAPVLEAPALPALSALSPALPAAAV